jgi:cell division protein FtsN
MLLPVPDETPLRVEASAAPRRYEAPTVRPEASTARSGTPAGPGVSIAMFEPAPPSEAQVEAYALSSPASLSGGLSSALADPSYPDSVAAAAESPASLAAEPESAVAFERVVPSWSLGGTELALDWPELEADELPATFLSMLPSPAMTIPATSLAEGEIILPHGDGPSALALETPSLGAAETVVALEDAEAEPEETPLAVASTRLEPSAEADSYALAEAEAVKPDTAGPLAEERLAGEPVDSSGSAGLAEAAETKPETAPIVESPAEDGAPAVALEPPREYIVALEPADAKPPVAPAATAPEKPATAPETLATAPAATATKPIVPHAIATPAATVMGALEKGRYYIQIGAFATEMAAKDALARLGGFVTLVQKTSDKGKDTFRVFVGPLSRDESGVALVRVRSLGYKDAFLKTGG